MTWRAVHACALNWGDGKSPGYDAFSANPKAGVYCLCDGANGAAGSDRAARWLADRLTAPGHRKSLHGEVLDAHREMLDRFPGTGSTFVRIQVRDDGLHLSGLGDSFLWLFERRWIGWGAWRLVHVVPRDLDAQGHPSQMVGSEVCHTVHALQVPRGPHYCAVLMSDGPGRLTGPDALARRLDVIRRGIPGPEDLQYLCDSMARDAQTTGCEDDISVALVWVRHG